MEESIVVCVVYGEHGVRLFERAVSLAEGLGARLTLVVLDPRSDDFDGDRLLDIPFFEGLIERAGGEMVHVRTSTDDLVPVLAQISREVDATQIVLAERAESLWSMLLESTLVDLLLREVPSADVHIVSSARSRYKDEWGHEPAVHAYIAPNGGEKAVLRYGDAPVGSLVGLFCRRTDTDFETGIFMYHYEGHVRGLNVTDGRVAETELIPRDWKG